MADTGPVHYLILIGEVSLLPALFERVFIPQAVWMEMFDAKTPVSVRTWIEAPPPWLQIVPDSSLTIDDSDLAGLDIGEKIAIQLAFSMKAALLLMDDRAGVAAALQKGLIVTGTLGILKLAATKNLVNVEAALDRLLSTNFRYSPELISQFRKSLAGLPTIGI